MAAEIEKTNSRKMIVTTAAVFVVFTIVIISTAMVLHYLYPQPSFFASLRASFGMVYTVFLPGYVFVHLFLDKTKLDWVEVLALSFAISFVIIIFTFLVTNQLLNYPITPLSSTIILLMVMVLMITGKLGTQRLLRYSSSKIKPNQVQDSKTKPNQKVFK